MKLKKTVPALILLLSPFAQAATPTESPKPLPAVSNMRYQNIELFQKVLFFIKENYVDPADETKLMQGAMKGMLDTLDPHSAFLPPEIFKEMKSDTSGKFGGVGIEVGMKDGNVVVIAPMEDTPAWKAGVKPGDKITRIEGESTKGMSLVEAVAKMRGKKGTKLKLSIAPVNSEKSKDLSLMRETIKVQSVRSEIIEDGIGWVRLSSFNEDAARDVKRGIEKLEKSGKLKGLILDLRYNPGGLLDQAVDVASLFMDDGVVVSTIGRDKAQKEVRNAKKGNARKDLPLAVLVNSGSASASEIVAGALQDNHRALILGQTTFGKGSVQTVVDLGEEMGVKLTIARYYTPSGRSIQEKGVSPDITLEDYDQKVLDQAKRKGGMYREKDLKGHMINPDLQAGSDSDSKSAEEDTAARYQPKEDYQVRQAVGYLKSLDFMKKMGQPQAQNGS